MDGLLGRETQSKEVEVLLKVFHGLKVVLTTKIGDLMGVEADTWETDGSLPVSKVVALVVGQLAELVEAHTGVVRDDKVLGGSDSTDGNLVRDQKELEVVRDDILVDHRSGLGIVGVVEEESVIDSLVDQDLGVLGTFTLTIDSVKGGIDGWKLSVNDKVGLGLAYTISVEDDHLWVSVVMRLISIKSVLHESTHAVDELLTLSLLDVGLRVELGEVGVHGGTETYDGALVVPSVMEDISTNEHGVI